MFQLTCAFIVSALTAFAGDISGTWQVIVETNQGTGSPTLVLQQQGEELTGRYSSRVLGEANITGTIKGTAIEFRFDSEVRGQAIKASYKGRIEGPNTMKGTAIFSGFDLNATWSAKRE